MTQAVGQSEAAVGRDATWSAVSAIAWREVVRFFRQRNRVMAAVVTPLLIWLVLGMGLNDAMTMPTPPEATPEAGVLEAGSSPTEVGPPLEAPVQNEAGSGLGYLAFFFPGMIIMVVLFTSIFSTISVIDDRNAGFLQGVLASPVKRWAVVLGKVLGGALIATVQGALLLPIWCVFFEWPGVGALAGAVGVLFVVSVGLTGMGLMFAWPMDSTAGYHAVMNLVQFPMWFLCGAVFPLATAGALKWVMYLNPLTYGNAAFSRALLGKSAAGIGLPWAVTLGIAVLASAAALAGATVVAKRGVSK
jgi:ABC-2 type transport system permease protein